MEHDGVEALYSDRYYYYVGQIPVMLNGHGLCRKSRD